MSGDNRLPSGHERVYMGKRSGSWEAFVILDGRRLLVGRSDCVDTAVGFRDAGQALLDSGDLIALMSMVKRNPRKILKKNHIWPIIKWSR